MLSRRKFFGFAAAAPVGMVASGGSPAPAGEVRISGPLILNEDIRIQGQMLVDNLKRQIPAMVIKTVKAARRDRVI